MQWKFDRSEMIYNGTLNDYKKICSPCTVFKVLLVIAILIIIGIVSAFIYFHWCLKNSFEKQFIKHINYNFLKS